MVTKRVTYEDYHQFSGESDLTLSETLDLFEKISVYTKAFMTIIVTDTNTFQIMVEEYGRLLAEVTNDDPYMIFKQKYVSKSECCQMISKLFEHKYTPEELNADFAKGFYDVSICNTTLEKVMNPNVKKESFFKRLFKK